MKSFCDSLQSSGQEVAEYKEGHTTLMSALLRKVDISYRVRPDVTDEQCRLFLSDTRNIFVVLHEVIPEDPFVHFLCVLSGVKVNKSPRERAAVVASMMCPYAQRLQRMDETALLSQDGVFGNFNSIAQPVIQRIWFSLTSENKQVLWQWILRILGAVTILTEPVG
jgi:hypothetical protein